MLLTLSSFSIYLTHPPSRPTPPGPPGRRKYLRSMAKGLISAKKASASEERRLCIDGWCGGAAMQHQHGRGDNPRGQKMLIFFKRQNGRANESTKYTKMLCICTMRLPKSYMFRGFLWYIIWVLDGQSHYFSWFWWLMVDIHIDTLLGTNISPPKGTFESMIFLFPRRDYVTSLEGTLLVISAMPLCSTLERCLSNSVT